jgi:hypothetical protein
LWLTNSAPYASLNAGVGGRVWGVSANEYSCAHGAQINFRDLAPYFLTCVRYLAIVTLMNVNRA